MLDDTTNPRAVIGGNNPPDDVDPVGFGYVRIHRAIRNHKLVGFGIAVAPVDPGKPTYSHNEAYVDLIMECRYQDGTILNRGRRMVVPRGSLLGGITYLAQRWNWTPKKVRWFLDALEREGMITRCQPKEAGQAVGHSGASNQGKQRGNQISLVSICNYDKYQSLPTQQGQQQGQANSEFGASNGATSKESKNKYIYTPPTPPSGVQGGDTLARQAEIRVDPPRVDPPARPAKRVTKPDIGRAEALAAFERYNAAALKIGLPQAAKLTPSRERSILARLRDFGPESWDKALDALGRWKWGTGDNPSGWRASLDFVLQASSYQKLVEGAYSAPAGAGAAKINGHPYTPPPRAESEDEYLRRNQERFARLASEG